LIGAFIGKRYNEFVNDPERIVVEALRQAKKAKLDSRSRKALQEFESAIFERLRKGFAAQEAKLLPAKTVGKGTPTIQLPSRGILRGQAKLREERPKGNPLLGVNELSKYVDEFFKTKPKEPIKDFEKRIFLDERVRISRKSIKYIVDSRKEDNYSADAIKKMILRAPDVIRQHEFSGPNYNKKHPGSLISIKIFSKQKQALFVIHQPDGEIEDVYNAFYRGEHKTRKKFNLDR